MSGRVRLGAGLLAALAALPGPVRAERIDPRHDLSVAGGATVKALSEDRVCVFCHAPHSTNPAHPLWNRRVPELVYTPYSSSTLRGIPGQPTGVSKLCLSCHDGTIALGEVLSRTDAIPMGGALAGRSNLTTDLSDDHPISFVYDPSLAAADQELVDPGLLDGPVELDSHGQMQCTSCHDPHVSAYPKLLVMDPAFSSLCLACHDPIGWEGSAHERSQATWNGMGADPWPHTSRSSVASNACESCHTSHGAASSEWLLTAFPEEEEVCLACHAGSVATWNIAAELSKPYRHPVEAFTGVHDPAEDFELMPRHVECEDCHDPHAATDTIASAPAASGPLRGVAGVTAQGARIPEARYEYEVCFRCHAGSAGAPLPAIERQVNDPDLRGRFSPSAASSHPVEGPGRSTDVPGLIPPWSTSSLLYCTDCHSSDGSPSGSGPRGPHGSSWPFLLAREYRTADHTRESAQAYALCYTCHDRGTLLSKKQSGFPEHRKHVEGEDTPCSACHDPHGIGPGQGSPGSHSHLINFDLGIVGPDPKTGRLEFVDGGFRQGECYLECHGKKHGPKRYPD